MNSEMFETAWAECVELQVQCKDVWLGRTLLSLQELDRYEIGVVIDAKVVGGVVVARDPWDCHVGPCTSVFAQYVMPQYRLNGISGILMREAVRIAKYDFRTHAIAYTHRQGPWRYETIYRRIHQ